MSNNIPTAHALGRWFIVAGSLIVVGCTDSGRFAAPSRSASPPSGTSDAGSTRPSERVSRPQEQRFEEITESVPEFAGYVLEGDDVVVYVTNPSRAAVIRPLVERAFQERRRAIQNILIRQVQYTFWQLRDWRDVATAQILPLEDPVSIDLNEGRNRLGIGLAHGGGRAAVESKLAELGIPLEAVFFEITGRVIGDSNHRLWDRRRPVQGGLQIDPVNNPVCTFGFNAMRQQYPPSNVFLTAAHCTPVPWGYDGTAIHQPLESDPNSRIGREVYDPTPIYFVGYYMRLADAALMLHETDSFELGFIARTIERKGPGRGFIASPDIDPNNPRFQIIGESATSIQGDDVDKVGRSTGWTWGDVTHTCVDTEYGEWTGPGTALALCQDYATYSSGGGDSGAPVFIWHLDNTVTLRGVHRGSTTSGIDRAVFASLGNVEQDLGALTTILAVDGEIVGPSVVESPGTYTWEVFAAGGNGQYSY